MSLLRYLLSALLSPYCLDLHSINHWPSLKLKVPLASSTLNLQFHVIKILPVRFFSRAIEIFSAHFIFEVWVDGDFFHYFPNSNTAQKSMELKLEYLVCPFLSFYFSLTNEMILSVEQLGFRKLPFFLGKYSFSRRHGDKGTSISSNCLKRSVTVTTCVYFDLIS